jgi:SAM-dependent methyltransferase
MPPDDVHAMARGPLAAGGDFWTADLVADAALRGGLELSAGQRVLDFGCSSARHLRVLQAWRPAVSWLGCDPNARAIAWDREHLPGIEFFVSPLEPPLELEAGSLDGAFAISVWSHFAEAAAIRWLEEMHRVIRPGGLLVFTTQGYASLAHYHRLAKIDDEYAVGGVEVLLRSGHAFVPSFGVRGDDGVKSPDWGMAYLSLDWLARTAHGRWSIESYEPARIEGNQDLVVLRRRN